MFYKLKEYDNIATLSNGVIVKDKVFVEDQELHILSEDTAFKLSNNKWYIKTPLTNNNYLYLGLGSFPSCILEVQESDILSENDFNLLFEITPENENN